MPDLGSLSEQILQSRENLRFTDSRFFIIRCPSQTSLDRRGIAEGHAQETMAEGLVMKA
jgi:hypothetical protein